MDNNNTRLHCFAEASKAYDRCMKRGFSYIDKPHVRKVVSEVNPVPDEDLDAGDSTAISVDGADNEEIDNAVSLPVHTHPDGIKEDLPNIDRKNETYSPSSMVAVPEQPQTAILKSLSVPKEIKYDHLLEIHPHTHVQPSTTATTVAITVLACAVVLLIAVVAYLYRQNRKYYLQKNALDDEENASKRKGKQLS